MVTALKIKHLISFLKKKLRVCYYYITMIYLNMGTSYERITTRLAIIGCSRLDLPIVDFLTTP